MANYGGVKGDHVSLSADQKRFIEADCQTLNDGQMARIIKSSRHIVTYYRKRILGILKTRTSRTVAFDGSLITMSQVNQEIKALQKFANYPALMNGAHDRMKYLMSIKEGVRIL